MNQNIVKSENQQRVIDNKIKGTMYEKQIKEYFMKLYPNNEVYLWKEVPMKKLAESGLIKNNSSDMNEMNRFHDIGCDIFMYDVVNKKYIIIQCKNYGAKSVYVCDLAGFFFLIATSDLDGIIVTNTSISKVIKKRIKYNNRISLMNISYDNNTGIIKNNDVNKKIKNEQFVITVENLINAKNITNEEFDKLMKTDKLSHEESYQIEKYMYKLNWGITNVTDDFLNKYFGKTKILFNLKYFLNGEIKPYKTIMLDDKPIKKFNVDIKKEQIKLIKDVLDELDFAEHGNLLNRDVFIKKIKIINEKCELFLNFKKNLKILNTFENNNKKSNVNTNTTKGFIGFMNSILRGWGMKIKVKNNLKRKKIDKKWTTVNNINYSLIYIEKLLDFIKKDQ
jgi:hypothetical protein